MGSFKDLLVYQKAYTLAIDIFMVSKTFPPEEKYGLTNQIRRSSRSVCANFAEAYRRRRFRPFFLSKLADCEAENTETEVWIDMAKDCEYMDLNMHQSLFVRNTEVGKLLFHMINNPDRYL